MVDKSKPQKLELLQSLNHDELLEQVLLPLFKRMGYEKIAYRHPDGKNLDAMLRYEDSFGEIIDAFLHAKLPALSSDNLDIQNEILANFERTFADKNGVEIKPKECVIATSGQIDDEVVQAIQRFSSEHHYDVRLLDGEKILQLAEKYRIYWTLEEYASEDGFTSRNPQMCGEFNRLVQQWKNMDHESQEGRLAAAEFYDRVLFPLIKEHFLNNPQNHPKRNYYGLILSVGMSPEPLILSILALKPERVAFLYTADTEQYLDRIIDETGLSVNQTEKREISSSNVTDIYDAIMHLYEKWGKRSDIAIDITGGKKAMVTGAAMAGVVLGADIYYVDNARYLPKLRRPDPGSEFLSVLPNPLEGFARYKRTLTFQIDAIIKETIHENQEDGQKVREFFQKAGFSIDGKMNALQFSVSSDNPALKRYGAIPVRILHHDKPTSESIREFYSDCKSNGVAENGLGFITVPPQLDTAVAMQMFVHRSESGFTIVPFTIYAIEQPLYENRCLKEVFDTIKLWKGEADLFGLSTPIRDPLWFVGREKVMDEIQEYIQSLQFVGIWGVRKVGKTSLLYQLTRKLENDVHAYVDLQAVSPNVSALFSKVLDGFERDIKLKFPNIELPKLGETCKKTSDGIISEFTDAIVKLRDRVEGESENAKFILFIDEVDRLFPSEYSNASGFSEYSSFLAAIRGLSQNYGFFVCVASGVEPTINLALLPGAGSVENPTYNFFKEVYLSYFEQQEMDEMIERIASQLGIAFTEAALNFVYEQTCGHPYLSRLLCSAIMKIRENKPKITINEARRGLKFLLSSPVFTEGVRHLRWLWNYLSDVEKEIVRKAKTNELEAFLSANDEKESLKEAVNKLIRLGYLESKEEGYRILPPIFEKYLVGMGLI